MSSFRIATMGPTFIPDAETSCELENYGQVYRRGSIFTPRGAGITLGRNVVTKLTGNTDYDRYLIHHETGHISDINKMGAFNYYSRTASEYIVFTYPNKFNISCFDCYNGMINTEVDGGVYPYEYVWPDDDAITTPERLGIGSGTYQVLVIDLNGCRAESYSGYLTAPERSDWTMGGNEGPNPGSDYIGTSDQSDLAFRTNGAERLRITSSGQLKISSLAGSESGFVYADADDNLGLLGPGSGTDSFIYGPRGSRATIIDPNQYLFITENPNRYQASYKPVNAKWWEYATFIISGPLWGSALVAALNLNNGR